MRAVGILVAALALAIVWAALEHARELTRLADAVIDRGLRSIEVPARWEPEGPS